MCLNSQNNQTDKNAIAPQAKYKANQAKQGSETKKSYEKTKKEKKKKSCHR